MTKRTVKIFSFLIIFSTLLGTFGICSFAQGSPPVANTDCADAICLYSVSADKLIYGKNTDKKIFPGSAVKMMTGLIACELLSSRLDERILITEEMLVGAKGASAKLIANTSVTVKDLLYGAICAGGNDAALSLAIACSGSVDAFVEHMNTTAKHWGLSSTHFTNPTGYDDERMYSTLSDIMIIARRAGTDPLYLDISSAVSYTYTPTGDSQSVKLFNRNSLIGTYYALGYKNPNASGLIAGNTDLGGHCVLTLAQKASGAYICAVMGATEYGDKIYSYSIANDLLEYAFDNFSYVKIAEKGRLITSLPVALAVSKDGKESKVSCVLQNDLYALVDKQTDLEDLHYKCFFHNNALNAPVDKNTVVGGVDIYYNGQTIATGVLITESDVEANNILLFLANARRFVTGRILWLSIAFFIVIFTTYVLLSNFKARHKSTKRSGFKRF